MSLQLPSSEQVYVRLGQLRTVRVPPNLRTAGEDEYCAVGLGLVPGFTELASYSELVDRELVDLRIRLRDRKKLCELRTRELIDDPEFRDLKPKDAKLAAIENRVHAEHGQRLDELENEKLRRQALRDAIERSWRVLEITKEVWNSVGRRAEREERGPDEHLGSTTHFDQTYDPMRT